MASGYYYKKKRRRKPKGEKHVAKKPVADVMTISEVIEMSKRYISPEDRAIFCMIYLTGGRVTEILMVRYDDINTYADHELGIVDTIKLFTLKNRDSKIRIVPLMKAHGEQPMLDYLLEYIKINWPKKDTGIYIFDRFTRSNIWNRLTTQQTVSRATHGIEMIEAMNKRINPHYLRHCRLTHLVQHYGFNDSKLTYFAGWTNSAPAQVYVHLNWKDLVRA